ncbi:MAG: hypothetical protein H0W75_04730 [Chitinophagaceae bacterium]|nr:hypothetical protein [Chitinophagaceae bacterium]
MKILLYSFCVVTLFTSGGCTKRCADYTTSMIRGPIEEYFGAYKPGNWWVYQNKDKTKKDSIYITDHSDTVLQNRTICLKYEERMYTIKSKVLMNGNDLYVISDAEKTGVDINFSLIKYQTQSGGFPQFRYDEDYNKLWSFPEVYNQGQNVFDSITLNNITYYNILQGRYSNNTYYFAKGKGLVGWTANGETFNLTHYKIL